MAEAPWRTIDAVLEAARRRVREARLEGEQTFPLVLPGHPDHPITHLTGWGLSHITGNPLSWRTQSTQASLEVTPHPELHPDPDMWFSQDETLLWKIAAEAVQAHAAEHAGPKSWLRFTTEDGKHPLAPRPSITTPAQWDAQVIERDRAIAKLRQGGQPRDALALVQAVGVRTRAGRQGHSPWDIMAQRRGDNLWKVALKVAEHVAGRDVADIADGLRGRTTVDLSPTVTGTAMGWAPEGQIDTAVVWCAIWGLLATPITIHGDLPNSVLIDGEWTMLMPIPTKPSTPADVAQLIRVDAHRREVSRPWTTPGIAAWVTWVRHVNQADKYAGVRLIRPGVRVNQNGAWDAPQEASLAQQLMAVERERHAIGSLDKERDRLIAGLVEQGDFHIATQITGMARAAVYKAAGRAKKARPVED